LRNNFKIANNFKIVEPWRNIILVQNRKEIISKPHNSKPKRSSIPTQNRTEIYDKNRTEIYDNVCVLNWKCKSTP